MAFFLGLRICNLLLAKVEARRFATTFLHDNVSGACQVSFCHRRPQIRVRDPLRLFDQRPKSGRTIFPICLQRISSICQLERPTVTATRRRLLPSAVGLPGRFDVLKSFEASQICDQRRAYNVILGAEMSRRAQLSDPCTQSSASPTLKLRKGSAAEYPSTPPFSNRMYLC